MRIIKISFILLILLYCSETNGQSTSDEYWNAAMKASKYYNNADYENAAASYKLLWETEYVDEIANHRLYAAASNCMIDNENAVKENLFKIVPIASKTDIRRVLINYEIFNKYKHKEWWKDLDNQLNQRLSDLIAHHKNLSIYKFGRNIVYSAIRINPKGDTIANTQVTMIPDGTGWGDEAADQQSQVIFVYKSSAQDSIDHYNEVDSIVGSKFWNNIDTTGVIENASVIDMHPFRNNEFFKTELAPFPRVYLPLSGSKNQSFKGATHIMSNWGWYNNTETKCQTDYFGVSNRTYPIIGEIECHKYQGSGDNSRYGVSTIEYYYNEEFGFTEMNYKTYDGDKIEFKIIDLIYTE